jgi:hypothetical protein
MVHNGYQREIIDRAMAEIERMTATADEVFDLLDDKAIARTSRDLCGPARARHSA